jgi:hypothetical protein
MLARPRRNTMHAAVVTTFDRPPAFGEFPSPTAQAADEMIVDVIASGLHPRVRSEADGSHYTSSGELALSSRTVVSAPRALRVESRSASRPAPEIVDDDVDVTRYLSEITYRSVRSRPT